jgi:NAD(P)H-hydrate epimerase
MFSLHEGEFSRLTLDRDTDRVQGAMALSRQTGCIILRKGFRTVITDGLHTYINMTGNPGMAAGGSGDVLAGILVSVLGRGIPPLKAAAAAAWVHGVCGDRCAERLGQYAMSPADLINALAEVLP